MLLAPIVAAAAGGFASGAAGGLFGGGGVVQQPAAATYTEQSPFSIAPAAYAAQMGALQSQLTTAAQGTALAQGGQWGAIGAQAQAIKEGQLAELQRQVASAQAARGLELGIAGQYAKAALDLEKATGAATLGLALQPTQTMADLAEAYGKGVVEMGKVSTQQLGELAKAATTAGGGILQQGVSGAAEAAKTGVAGQAGIYQSALQSAGQQLNAAALADLYKPAATAVAQMGTETVASQNRLMQDIASTNLRIAEAQEQSRNRIAEQRAQIEGQLAIKRFGRGAALAGKASVA